MTEERDPKLSQHYRELPGREPSREIDQAILAAAHRSVDTSHAPLVVPAGRHRWYFSLAAAAVLVLAIAVTVHVERQQPDAELAVPPPSPPAAAPQQNKVEPSPEAAPPAAVAQPRRDVRAREERRPSAYTPDPSPATPPSAADSASTRQPAEAEAEAKRGVVESRAARQAPAPAAAATRAAPLPRSSGSVASQYSATNPESELERIAELRRQGRDEEADKALAEFHKRYPDYVIPDAMKAKVERR